MSETVISGERGILNPREIFLQAGIILLSTEGPDGLSMNGILAQARKPRGSFYAAYDSKDAYMAALIHRYFQPSTEILELFAANAESGGDDTIRAWASYCEQRHVLAAGRGERIVSLTEMAGRCQNSSVTADTCEALFRTRTQALGKIMAAAEFIPVADAELRACLLLAMLDGVESRASAMGKPELIRQFFTFLF